MFWALLGRILPIIFTIVILSSLNFTEFPLNTASGLTIPVGTSPSAVAVNEIANIAYVSNRVTQDISVIDGATNTVITTVPAGVDPAAINYVPSTNRLYIVNQAINSVKVLDATTFAFVADIPVGPFPVSTPFNPNTNQMYVLNTFDSSISVIDLNTNSVIDIIFLGTHPLFPSSGPFVASVNKNTNLVYVSNIFSSSISILDASNNNEVIGSILVPGGAGQVGINENTNEIYIPTFFSNQVLVLDGSTNTVTNTITVGSGPRQAFFNPNTNQVYTNNFASNTISVIDASTNTVIATVPAANPSAMWANTVTNIIYAVNTIPNTLQVIDLSSNSPPTANAGPNQSVEEGTFVTLDGSASSDPNNDSLTFQWIQTNGPPVTLSDDSIVNPSFTAPQVDGQQLLQFTLIVNDGVFDSGPDTVNVGVNDVTTFDVILTPAGDGVSGSVNVGTVTADTTVNLQFFTPVGVLSGGELDQTQVTSAISGNGVEFDFAINSDIPLGLPPLPVDSALFYDINFQGGIDFSDPSNLLPDKLPTSKFTINKDFETLDKFADGSPIVKLFLLDEINNVWNQLGDPLEPNTNRVYTADTDANTVSVIDIATNTVIDTIPVGITPRALAFLPSNNQVYVSNFVSGTVSVIDGSTNTVIDTVPVGIGPFGLAVNYNTNQIYVANFGSGTVSVIDGTTHAVTDTITVGGNSVVAIGINQNTNRAYVTDFFTNNLSVIDTNTNTVIDTITVANGPSVVSVNPNTNTVYVSQFLGGSVAVIDGAANAIIDIIPIGGSPAGLVINPNTNLGYVVNTVSNSVSVIETISNSVITEIPVGISPFRIDVIPDINRIYVGNGVSGTVSVIDGLTNSVVDTITVGGNSQIVITNPNVSNPLRDPSTDVKDPITGQVLEFSYFGKMPHLSKFAIGGIKALALGALSSGGGSGSANSPPSISPSSFSIISDGEEGFGGILNDNVAKTLDETQTFKVGDKVVLRFDLKEGGGIGNIEHVGLYTNIKEGQNKYASDTYIYYDPLKSPKVTVHDPNGFFSDANIELLQKDATNFVLKFEMTFAKPMAKSDLILESWNTQKWSSLNKIPNAIEVVSSGLVQQSESEPIVDTFVEDVTNDHVIPVWVKSNAKWWSDGTIDNENFISGIEYLVNEGIITVSLPNSNGSPSISEVKPWIKNTAGWWADDMIRDDEFLVAIEWLISNGIIQVE